METTVNQLRKSGKLKDAYLMAENKLIIEPKYEPYLQDMQWVYYSYLKLAVDINNAEMLYRITDKIYDLSYLDNLMFNESVNWQLVKFINKQPGLSSGRSRLFDFLLLVNKLITGFGASQSKSVLIKTMLKKTKGHDYAWMIVDMLGLDNYMDQDFVSETYKDVKMMPLYEQLLYTFIKTWLQSLEDNNADAVSKLSEVMEILNEKKINKYKFTAYYQAKVYLMANLQEDAYRSAINFVRKNYSQSWAWEMVAKCTNDSEQQISLLIYALSVAQKEAFSVGILDKLVYSFVEKDLSIAQYYARKLIVIKNKNKWNIKSDILKISNEENDNEVVIEKVKQLTKKSEKLAILTAFDELQFIEAIIVSYNSKKRCYFVLDANGNSKMLRTKKRMPIGQMLDLKIYKGNIISHNEIKAVVQNNYIRQFEGKIKRVKDFAFVNSVYINSRELSKIALSKQTIKGIAIKEINPKTKKSGWRAIVLS